MRADEANRWSAARHDEPGATIGDERREARFAELDDEWLGNAVAAGGKANRAGFRINHRLDSGCVVRCTIAFGPKVEHGEKAAALVGLALGDAFDRFGLIGHQGK